MGFEGIEEQDGVAGWEGTGTQGTKGKQHSFWLIGFLRSWEQENWAFMYSLCAHESVLGSASELPRIIEILKN